MADASRLLLAALREEEPRAVEELLRRGADPSLVLEDGAAAVHLAARARSPSALHCLRILLRRGADPNARSAEGLTPVHVAAAWGCHSALKLLLSQGGDPWLRDQDGLRPLDWALQQGHQGCALVLRDLDTPIRTREESSGPADVERHMPAVSRSRSPEAIGSTDCSSDASFVTALEDSPKHQHPAETPESVAGDRAPSCQLQALTLTTEASNGDPGTLHPHSPVPPMSDLQLLQALRALGYSPGPVTPFTRGHYLRRLQEAQGSPGHSPELAQALRTGRIPDCQEDEAALARLFQQPDPVKRWREGVKKSCFTYLLLDPREGIKQLESVLATQGLPARASSLPLAECLRCFVRAIFYVGKGTRARPDAHLWEALGYCERPREKACPKVRRILDIWDSGRGVISLHCFQHAVAMEAYTREACLLDALGIQTLTNQRQGHYYGEVAYWPPTQRRRLGVHLLHRAMLVFLAEGERELRPQDIQARG